jgi:putative membrane protein
MHEGRESNMMGIYGGGMGGGPWILIGLFWIALIALIIWLVVRLIPSNRGASAPTAVTQPGAPVQPAVPAQPTGAQESPVEILDRRFARGEIDLETYQTHRAALIAARGGV